MTFSEALKDFLDAREELKEVQSWPGASTADAETTLAQAADVLDEVIEQTAQRVAQATRR
jgi:hypothetical protein